MCFGNVEQMEIGVLEMEEVGFAGIERVEHWREDPRARWGNNYRVVPRILVGHMVGRRRLDLGLMQLLP